MALYIENEGNFIVWTGQPINGVQHPLDIERIWSDAELAAHGLYRLVDPGIPSGKVSTGQTVQNVGGKPTVVYTLVDEPKPTLTKRQIGNALIASGMTLDPDAWVANALSFVDNPVQRALALNDWKTAPYYERTHPMFNNTAVLSGVGITTQQIDQLWALAATLPA